MVARGLEWVRETDEHATAVVSDHRGLAVHRPLGSDDLAAVRGRDRLVSEADAQNGDPASGLADQLDGDTGILGTTGSGRDDDSVRRSLQNLRDRRLVVSNHIDSGPHCHEGLHQIEGEGVIVVDDDDPHESPSYHGSEGYPCCRSDR